MIAISLTRRGAMSDNYIDILADEMSTRFIQDTRITRDSPSHKKLSDIFKVLYERAYFNAMRDEHPTWSDELIQKTAMSRHKQLDNEGRCYEHKRNV